MQESSNFSDLSANVPAIGAMSIFTASVFGNTGLQIAPSQTGEVNYSFGQLSYYSLESQLTLQQLMSATQPESILPGQSQGQQNISGQYTVTGPAGNVQVAIGSADTNTGGF